MAMDVDDDEGTQRPKEVQTYGIEVDFGDLDDEEREVCLNLNFINDTQLI